MIGKTHHLIIMSGQLPLFICFLMKIIQQSLTVSALFFTTLFPVEYLMVTGAHLVHVLAC